MAPLKRLAKSGAWAIAGGVFSALGFSRGVTSPRRRRLDLSEVRSILAIRLDLMGDLVFTLPAVHALHQAAPHARITMLVLPYTAELLRGVPYIHRVLPLDVNRWRKPQAWLKGEAWREIREAVALVREERYDLCVSFYGRVGASAALLSGARYLAGYQGEGYPSTFDLGLPGARYVWRRHESEYCLALARALGGTADGVMPKLPVDPTSASRVAQLLAQAGVESGEPLVALHPGALNMAAKRWLPERWATVADQVQGELGLRVVLVGSGSELPLVDQVVRSMRSPVLVMAGRTTVAELAALLSRCCLFLGGDSGPLHVASALGVPSVSIYGPTDPAHTGPLGPNARVIRVPEECSPCYDPRRPAQCRKWDISCMAKVSVEEVFEAVREAVGGKRRGDGGTGRRGDPGTRGRGDAANLPLPLGEGRGEGALPVVTPIVPPGEEDRGPGRPHGAAPTGNDEGAAVPTGTDEPGVGATGRSPARAAGDKPLPYAGSHGSSVAAGLSLRVPGGDEVAHTPEGAAAGAPDAGGSTEEPTPPGEPEDVRE